MPQRDNRTTGVAADVPQLAAAYFDDLSSQWQTKYDENGSMHYRIRLFVDAIDKVCSQPGKILDFGCGCGDLSSALASAGFNVCGCDISAAMIERACRRFSGRGIQFANLVDPGSPPRIPYESNTFDAIIASSVFEYIRYPDQYLSEIRRTAKAGASLLLSVPNQTHPLRWIEAGEKWVLSKLGGSVPLFMQSRSQYLNLSINRFSLGRWRRILMDSGFECVGVSNRRSPLMLVLARAC